MLEPPEAAALASTPCVVVALSNALSACHVAVGETVTELRYLPCQGECQGILPVS